MQNLNLEADWLLAMVLFNKYRFERQADLPLRVCAFAECEYRFSENYFDFVHTDKDLTTSRKARLKLLSYQLKMSLKNLSEDAIRQS